MLRCFWDRGGKGGSNEDWTLFVYLDILLIWVIITIRLLCLCFDENRFMGSVANVNQGELWNHIFVLLDKKEKRERSSRGNGCLKKKRGRREEKREKREKSR